LSEALTSAIRKVDMRRHIDAIEQEVAELRSQGGPPKEEGEPNDFTDRLQEVLRAESAKLARELGVGGGYPLRFILTNAIICLAWSAYSIKKTSLDQSLPFDETLDMVDLASGLGDVLSSVAAEAARYAELSSK